MRRALIRLEELAAWPNLLLATHKAARAKRQRPEVMAFLQDLPANLTQLGSAILTGGAPQGHYRYFTIHDPKRRLIHAACFADRVLHHAIFNLAEPTFEKALLPSCYACRPGKGVHRAVVAAQRNLQRYAWYAKIDIDGYFASIRHDHLHGLLAKRFKGAGFLALLQRIIAAAPLPQPGRGLPIGSLTSQHFANLYLSSADRLIQACPGVRAQLRYMDDILWWADAAQPLRDSLVALQDHLNAIGLNIKSTSIQIQPSAQGVSYCGFRIRRGVILPSRRKLHRYRQHQRNWCEAAATGGYPESDLQRWADVYEATLAHTTSLHWRKRFWLQQQNAYTALGDLA
jgi:hypothetical protein